MGKRSKLATWKGSCCLKASYVEGMWDTSIVKPPQKDWKWNCNKRRKTTITRESSPQRQRSWRFARSQCVSWRDCTFPHWGKSPTGHSPSSRLRTWRSESSYLWSTKRKVFAVRKIEGKLDTDSYSSKGKNCIGSPPQWTQTRAGKLLDRRWQGPTKAASW